MEKQQIKEELINRFKYIYENSEYILAPYMYKQTESERNEINKKYKEEGFDSLISDELLIYLKKLPVNLLLDIESFLLSDIPFSESKLFNELEEQKKTEKYLLKVKEGLNLIKEKNNRFNSDIFKEKLDSWNLYLKVREFINEQSGDLSNKKKKLSALDEYFRINRYKNDGKIWSSGYSLYFKDVDNYDNFSYSAVIDKNPREPIRDKNDIGLRRCIFTDYVSNYSNHYDYNNSLLTEEEKQNIYLLFHDELPCDLEKICELEDEYMPTMIETRLVRPDHTSPCGESFNIKENEIFINPNDSLYRYYHICPYCGYIVNVPKEILSDGIKKRIEERCEHDPNLFRKMFLYSELFSLDKNSTKNQIKILKK